MENVMRAPAKPDSARKLAPMPRDEKGRPIHNAVAMTLDGRKMVARDPVGGDFILWVQNRNGSWSWTYGWGPSRLALAIRALEGRTT